MIQTKELSRSYFTEEVETRAVQRVSLEIEKGEFVAVMGPSGCGKTSLFNLLGLRSDERRVGKGCLRMCKSRWSPYQYKRKVKYRV